ncbi:23S rRNA (adenine(2030)-N(6))-methyltransferase RlmJ [Jannaschia ovalis]|uniref:Ribosomal RNA large subunit methyltransferase J n=1 Tax=Jannaschia ovalis TaxID=3038773 RepID=A0ABY8LEL2_9RHOB|nr:23S rRNA (adenine(2030)-N(6))-methyltransferase RlmJ [Jannaschia sp. GRR-S6-38]WGH79732.1 23S rRNA (adenine(2030)-N(6))-methyltransferase RlmJ [Jannaschia sp. GRR-S6-38]
MLSYQHGYHAGNAADVHKHALLAWALAYMTQKDKALSYLETHAGRGLYDLSDAMARKTGEAAQGVARLLDRVAPDHPWRRAVAATRAEHGPDAYPGSPLIAAHLTRAFDRLDLAELHPAEHAALIEALPRHPNIRIHKRDGLEMAKALTPPDPRRGLILIDPSWEIRDDYTRMAKLLPALHAKWNVGVLMLWYPILPDRRHAPMLRALRAALPDALVHEIAFPPARDGHGMQGSGMVVVNPPWGLDAEAARLDRIFAGG